MPEVQVLRVGELLTREFPPSESILGDNLIDRRGAVLISGPQKVGKSLFTTQLALCIADQMRFLGFSVGAGRYTVLALQAEVGERRMQERFAKQICGFSEQARRGVLTASVFSSIKLDKDEGAETVLALVDQHRPDVLIIDPLANFHTGDENEARDMTRVTSMLDALRQRGCAVILVHHHGKNSSRRDNVGHKARGSSVLPGWYDSHLSLEWAEFQRTVRLRFELRHGEAPSDLIIRLDSSTLLFELASEDVGQLGLVVAAIRELGPSDAETVGRHYNRTRQWASEWLNRAVEQERLASTQVARKMLFHLPDEPPVQVEVPLDRIVVSTHTASGTDCGVRPNGIVPFP